MFSAGWQSSPDAAGWAESGIDRGVLLLSIELLAGDGDGAMSLEFSLPGGAAHTEPDEEDAVGLVTKLHLIS